MYKTYVYKGEFQIFSIQLNSLAIKKFVSRLCPHCPNTRMQNI